MKKDSSDSCLPNNVNPDIGFTNGIFLDGFGDHYSLDALLSRGVLITKETNGGYKISSLLQALNEDLTTNWGSPEFSVANTAQDWEQLVFPTHDSNNPKSPYCSNFIVGDEGAFQEVIEAYAPYYPKDAHIFALRFFGIDPPNHKCDQFLTGDDNVARIARITDSLRIMGRPDLAQDFIDQVIDKYKAVYKSSEIDEQWKAAKIRADEAADSAMINLINKLESKPSLLSSEALPPEEIDTPNNYDAVVVFQIGIYVEDHNALPTLSELFTYLTEDKGYEVSSLLQALHGNFNENVHDPENSVAAKYDDWDQLIFPTHEASYNGSSALGFTVKDEVTFQEVIKNMGDSYPDKAYNFALNFFGIIPDNPKCDGFFTGANIQRITRITDSLRIMGRPDLAKSFIAYIMAKHKIIFPNAQENEEWKEARTRAEMAPLNSLAVLQIQPDLLNVENQQSELGADTAPDQDTDKKLPAKIKPNNSDPVLGFRNGIHLERSGDHQTFGSLKQANLCPKKQRNGCYKISHLLEALNKDLLNYGHCPEFSAAGECDDWVQLIFPTQERPKTDNSPYTCNFTVKDEASFRQTIKKDHASYPDKAYAFALHFFGIEPQNDRSSDFFSDRNVDMVTKITDSLSIMGRPDLAVSFIEKVMVKHEGIFGKVEIKKWRDAYKSASIACIGMTSDDHKRQKKAPTNRKGNNGRKFLRLLGNTP